MNYLTYLGIAYQQHINHIEVQLPHVITDKPMTWVPISWDILYDILNDFRWRSGYTNRLKQIESAGVHLDEIQ